jgi:hypothetical protein
VKGRKERKMKANDITLWGVIFKSWYECDLIWKDDLCRYNEVKIMSYWNGENLRSSMSSILIRREETQSPRQRPCEDGGTD